MIDKYGDILSADHESKMARKLGLSEYDQDLSLGLMKLMSETRADMTNTYRSLSQIARMQDQEISQVPSKLAAVLAEAEATEEQKEAWLEWVKGYQAKLRKDPTPAEAKADTQDATNPCYILRNHLCQEAIEAAEDGDFEPTKDLLELLRNPFEEQEGKEKYTKVVPKEMDKPGVSMLSCSS